MGGNILDLDPLGNQFHLHLLQGLVEDAHRLAAPAVGAEGRADTAPGFQPFEIADDVGHAGQDAVVQGGGAEKDGLGVQNLGGHVAPVVGVHVHHLNADALLHEGAPDGLGHLFGALPHGVVDDNRLIAGFLPAPAVVGSQDGGYVFAPDYAVIRGNGIDLNTHLDHLGQKFLHQGRKGQEDVGVIFFRMRHEFGVVHLIVEALRGAPVLAKGVAGDEHLVLGKVGKHRVRPVQHPGFDKVHGLRAQADGVAGIDHLQRPVLAMEVLDDGLLAHGRAEDFLWFDQLDHGGQTAGMVHLHMVDYDVVDLGRIHDLVKVMNQVALEAGLHRVEQGDLLILHQKGVVGGALVQGIAMEIAQIPVQGANPVDILLDFNGLHGFLRVDYLYNLPVAPHLSPYGAGGEAAFFTC